MAVLVVVVLIAVSGFLGWRAGVVRRLSELLGLLLSILASARFASAVAPWIAEHTAMDEATALFLAYVLVFVVGLVVTRLLASVVQKLFRLTLLGWVDQLGGAVCGVLVGALLASVGLIAVSQGPGGDRVRDTFEASRLGDAIYHAAPTIYRAARKVVGGKTDEIWERALAAGQQAVDTVREETDELRERAEDAARDD